MPRRSGIGYYDNATRKGYYTKIHGKKIKLADGPDDAPHGKNYLTALESFKRLMERGNLENAGDGNTVRAVCDAYLDAKNPDIRQSTARMKRDKLSHFITAYGDLPVADLKTHHAETLIAKMRKRRTIKQTIQGRTLTRMVRWSNSSVRQFLSQLKACFNWAFNNELITRNPFKSIKPPSMTYRSRERIVSQEEHEQVLASLKRTSSQPLRCFIIALENTGARPSELRHAKVSDFNQEDGAIIYFADEHRKDGEHQHKTSGKGKHRVILFTGEVLEMVSELVKGKQPNDYIFTNRLGKPFSCNGLDAAVSHIAKRLKLPHYIPYSYRHTFATKWLIQGKSIDKLAALLGNSPATIRLHYSHLIHEHETLRADLEKFRQQERMDNGSMDYEEMMLKFRAAK